MKQLSGSSYFWLLSTLLTLIIFQNCSPGMESLASEQQASFDRFTHPSSELDNESLEVSEVQLTPDPQFKLSLKYFFPRSARLFSPRFVGNSPQKSIDVANAYHANGIVWHYKNNNQLVQLAQKQVLGLVGLNCALPAMAYSSEEACISTDTQQPILHHASSPTAVVKAYYPDVTNPTFRKTTLKAIKSAAQAGCTSLQQDDAYLNYSYKALGCYKNRSDEDVKQMVRDYYTWIRAEMQNNFGHQVPITHNKILRDENYANSKYNDLRPLLDGAMMEVLKEQNFPESLFEAIVLENLIKYDMTSITTLVDDDTIANRRHIASIYALGAHPIAPWDVYIGPGKRFYGSPALFKDYYKIVKDYSQLFDGHSLQDVYIDHYKNSSGLRSFRNTIRGVPGRHNVMAVLNARINQKHRVLHVINWQRKREGMTDEKHYFTFWIKKSEFDFIPKNLVVHYPGREDFNPTIPIISEGDEYKITVPTVDIWAIAKIE